MSEAADKIIMQQHIMITNFAANLDAFSKSLDKDIDNVEGMFAYITDGILHLLRDYQKFVLEDKFKESKDD